MTFIDRWFKHATNRFNEYCFTSTASEKTLEEKLQKMRDDDEREEENFLRGKKNYDEKFVDFILKVFFWHGGININSKGGEWETRFKS